MEGKQTPVTIDIPASLHLVAFFFNLFISLTISHSKPNHHLQHWTLAHLSNKERVSQV